ncbi:hydrogenase [Legionella quinlivanii]|uniref:tRNA pseudouridine synthase D n=1 Tax=Legionella quinlivanii TaxID=45073 RepID=A0A0W0XLT1_9GAMM|nr:tRNA pseudouridine(13) synthase TruD [Legionella quinlivanii]KTD45312.1 hydrogenase [Legionella quinlivanii]MCW8450433.1 tRNA pseudouridine(13) synthase TruD [Legionella quinlivanii]SEG02056.1 tRNA pseudouridine13 synthase [Legionella quinlivanii DSM 21216]STY11388.1 hydrogenase [Legionella quinlivanii]
MSTLAYAYGQPASRGILKQYPEDFIVNEILGFDLTGEGEHLFLFIEKRTINTEDVAREIARELKLSPRAVSYAGLKDRQALTRQWFSIHLPGKNNLNIELPQGEQWKILNTQRHNKKLKTGALDGNQFQLILRDIHIEDKIEERLAAIAANGVPNYFGEQRFGNNGQNLYKAEQLLFADMKVKNPFLKGMYYSAARAYLFNRILDYRIGKGNWNQAVAGDVMQLAGTHSVFHCDSPDEIIQQRIKAFDISPAGALWGGGNNRVTDSALALQQEALADLLSWCEALEAHKLEIAYRAFILQVKDMRWEWLSEKELFLEFALTSGSYATSVIRELLLTLKE